MSEPFSFKYHRFQVPLDWNDPQNTNIISIVLREVVDNDSTDKPPLLYFQGGPGFGVRLPTDEKWINELKKRYRIFLLDQRGTGLSTPIDISGIAEMDKQNRQETIKFLSNFRADSIARDAEHIRLKLFSEDKFTTFGQSFGGWCTFSYLSLFPNSASTCFLTGGFPPVGHGPLDVYRNLLPQVDETNKQFFDKYPDTKKQLKELMNTLDSKSLFSLARCGFSTGYSPAHGEFRGLIESLYYETETLGRITSHSIKKMEDPLSFSSNPIYALLHEPIYCEGIAPAWSGETVMINENKRPSLDDCYKFFLAENIFRKTFDQSPELQPIRGLMDALMEFDGWGQLYNVNNLKDCESTVIGVVYESDAAVVASYSLESANLLGNGHVIESSLDHSAYRSDSEEIFGKIFDKNDEVVN